MANEIRLTASLSVDNGDFKEAINPGSLTIDQATIGKGGYVQTIGTTNEALVVGDVATLGYCYLRNLDATNAVEYGPDSGGAMISFGKLKAGEVAILRLTPGITVRAQAENSAVKLDVRVFED